MFITPMTPITPLAQLRAANQTQPERASGTGVPFRNIFDTAIQNLRETEQSVNNNTALLALGQIDDLHTLGIETTRAQLALQMVVELRNRTMESYSELMRINL